MIELCTLFSGSSGNSTLVRTDRTAVLVDAGRNCKAVCGGLAALGMSLSDISAVFVTHEHGDHISALDVMMRKREIPIHITQPSARELCRKPDAARCAVIHRGLVFREKIGDITVSSFPLPHDSAAHVGYAIMSDDGDKAGVATDMGHVTAEALENLSGCRCAVVEANHDEDMLKDGDYPYYLKQRILSPVGHLSNKNCARLSAELARRGTKRIMLAHLSRDNNTPELAVSVVRQELDAAGFEFVVLKAAPRSGALVL